MLDSTGRWYQPASNAPAIKAALLAAVDEVRDYAGSYTDDDLREFRRALRALDSEMSKRIGSLVPGDPEWTGEFDADGNPIPRSAFAGNPGHVGFVQPEADRSLAALRIEQAIARIRELGGRAAKDPALASILASALDEVTDHG